MKTRILDPVLRNIIFFLVGLLTINAKGAEVKGIVTGDEGEPLSYVSIAVKNTTIGTSTNLDGEYLLRIKPGRYVLLFRYIGYGMQEKAIEVTGDEVITLNVTLYRENLAKNEIVVTAGEDPAYRVIRNAIKMRKKYLEEVKSYSCKVYIKGVSRFDSFPDKIMFIKLDSSQIKDLEKEKGIIYLSESVSEYYIEAPDREKEIMVSSKVSGNSQGFSWNSALGLVFNFYENMVGEELNERGFISPIASNAMFFYKYRMEGVFFENGRMVNKIQVIPRRGHDPVFGGYIYIIEDTWRIHSTELKINKEVNLDFIDSLQINQLHTRVGDSVYRLTMQHLEAWMGILGFKLRGTFVGSFTNYVLDPSLGKKFFGNELMKVRKNSNKKDSSYWDSIRPIPLTVEEARDYGEKDSVEKIHSSKEYLDSIDKRANKISLVKFLISGYTYSNRFRNFRIRLSPLINNLNYNTVEGITTALELTFRKELGEKKYFSLSPAVRYGFSNGHLNAKINGEYYFDPFKKGKLSFGGGKFIYQFNPSNPVPEYINTYYTILEGNNYMKIYEKAFVSAGFGYELINGISFRFKSSLEERIPLRNTTFFSLEKDVEWTDNYPAGDRPGISDGFPVHRAFINEAVIRLVPGQKYISRPFEKIILGSDYPIFEIRFQKAIPGIAGSVIDFERLEAEITDEFFFGLIGVLKLNFTYGKYLSKKRMEFMDYRHFGGNRTFFLDLSGKGFNLLDYYSYSSNNHYMIAHAEHHFNGFLINKIPLLRKTEWQVVGGISGLYTPGRKEYFEVSAGLEHIFKFLRLDFITSYGRFQRLTSGFRLGLGF